MTRIELKKSEASLKKTVIDYLTYKQNLGELMWFPMNAGNFYVPNKNGTTRLVRGCQAGTADVQVIVGYRSRKERLPKVYFIELKSPAGKQSKAQKEFQELVNTQGCLYYLIRSIEEVMLLLYPDQQL